MDNLVNMNNITTALGYCDLSVSEQLATTAINRATKAFCKCDKCGKMAEVDTSMILTSYPPQYNYYCKHCGTYGYTYCDNVVYREENIKVDTDNQVLLTACLICGETVAIPATPNYDKAVVCEKCKQAVLKIRAMEDQIND